MCEKGCSKLNYPNLDDYLLKTLKNVAQKRRYSFLCIKLGKKNSNTQFGRVMLP